MSIAVDLSVWTSTDIAAQLPLLDPDVNPSPFPDEDWRDFVQEYNTNQRVLRQIFMRLADLNEE